MKPIVWVRQVKISTRAGSAQPTTESSHEVPRLSLADKAAFFVLAAGLLALGGVLFAAGLALLLALAAGGLVLGAVAVARRRLFGHRPTMPLAPGEIPSAAVVLPRVVSVQLPSPAQPPDDRPPGPPGPAPRAD